MMLLRQSHILVESLKVPFIISRLEVGPCNTRIP